MVVEKGKLKYALPRAEEYLRIVMNNVYSNLRDGNSATIRQSPLLQRAHAIVNEVGVIPYRDYNINVQFVEDTE